MSEPIASVSGSGDVSARAGMAAVASAPAKIVEIDQPKPETAYRPRPNGRPNKRRTDDTKSGSNRHINLAKKLVVNNYNSHHDPNETPPLTVELVYVSTFNKVIDNWKAIVESTTVKGLLYEVTYNAARSEATIAIFQKINQVKIAVD
jgi:hypothetical protein